MPKTVNPGFGIEEPSSPSEATTIISHRQFKIKQVELQECRNILPHGLFVNGERLRNFDFKEYDGSQDLKLSTIYSNQKADIKQILSGSLPSIINTIEGHTLKEIAAELSCTPQTVIERLLLGDALAIVLNARMHFAGNLIEMEEQCPNCKTLNKDEPEEGRPYHDISGVKIGMIPEVTDKLTLEVKLKKPFKVGDDACRLIHMRPVRLYQMQKLQQASQKARGKVDITMMQHQICAIPEATSLKNIVGQIFDDHMYSQILDLQDLKTLKTASEKLQQIGPDMNVDMSCYNCDHAWQPNLPWGNLRKFFFEVVDADDEEDYEDEEGL